ncbi:3-phenylpropionate/trans-cinnamate dioxygenase ferredoxin reductase subunit [Kaistia soli DSM 19436]|uniref:3-phenylpropionate/trans-cinnamate dioxygenase ferredoxin reductase subunit n=1 Tax=Kaistia soli DSM 19436 TaxID=1122133 RepID=A0A1M4X471_9HYPH|nr:FAD-dependent oxidoreductase [Kaistia soli]SHE88261.1 3-phenylpropionate/trans-cinnamate dioxygenase ferredoxin reductase subunit [Kaistia soli DSM 19436]
MTEHMVVIGAGEAGARAAMALRENGFAGTITLIGDEHHLPYERPPLSKAVLTGAEEPAPPHILDEARLAARGVSLLHGTAAIAIDRAGHRVALAGSDAVPYDRLLIATGARARRLAVPGTGPETVHYLRSFPEALALRRRLVPGHRLIVIGGGFIGLELAAAARARGADATVIEMAPRLLGRAVPQEFAALLAARHEAEGVRLVLGATIDRIETTAEAHSVVLGSGEIITGDTIVAGIGALPETALAEAAGLAIDNGIAVDASLATDDPDIFAAGDCCSFPHPLYDGRRIRLEAWRNAQDQGNAVAKAMLGGREPYEAVPWFWSDQYDLTLQIAGLSYLATATVTRDLGDGARLDFHLADDGRLVSASALGPNGRIARDVRLAEMLIARRARPPAADLADPATKLKSLMV